MLKLYSHIVFSSGEPIHEQNRDKCERFVNKLSTIVCISCRWREQMLCKLYSQSFPLNTHSSRSFPSNVVPILPILVHRCKHLTVMSNVESSQLKWNNTNGSGTEMVPNIIKYPTSLILYCSGHMVGS